MKAIVTDGQLGKLAVKQHELFERAKRGVYESFDAVLDAVQQVIEGQSPVVPTLAAEAKNTASRTVLSDLFAEVGVPIELGAVKHFVAREKFVEDRNGELPISSLGSNFKENFLDVIEENVAATMLTQRKLRKRSVDAPILAAHGDTDLTKIEKTRVALAHVFSFLKTVDRKRWFLFYVADAKELVWAVNANWNGGGLNLGARSVSHPGKWDAGFYVVSPQILK